LETRQPPAEERDAANTDFGDSGVPELPFFWSELSRKVARKWPLPVFWLAVAATVAYVWARPKGEERLSPEEYLRDARRAFAAAVEAQDDRADAAMALRFLAGEHVNGLAILKWREREQADTASNPRKRMPEELRRELSGKFKSVGDLSEGMIAVRKDGMWGFVDLDGRAAAGFFSEDGKARLLRPRFQEVARFFDGLAPVKEDGRWHFVNEGGAAVEPGGVHGVLPSYDRVIAQVGEGILGSDDLGCIGAALYRLGKIKQEHPGGIGKAVTIPLLDLYRKAARRLEAARVAMELEASRAREAASKSGARDEDREKAEELTAALESSVARRRRRMWAECQVHLGDHKKAIDALQVLIAKMNAAESKKLRREKDPARSPRGNGGQFSTGRDSAEWARVYELLARSYGKRKQYVEAAKYYRLFLEQGTGGLLAYSARVRLAELTMEQSIAQKDAAKAGRGFAEVAILCRRVEQSDAPTRLREDATFLRGRASYRLGGLLHAGDASAAAFNEAASAFRYNYAPSRKYLDMSRVLLARALFFAGSKEQREEAMDILEGVLRVGASPAIYACAEVSRADMLLETNTAEAVGGRIDSKRILKTISLAERDTAGKMLGVRVRDLSSDLAAALGLERGGAEIIEVLPDGPAQEAGLRPRDVVTNFGKKQIVDAADLLQAAAALGKDGKVKLVALRPNQQRGLTHGYIDAIGRIRKLSAGETGALVPELAALLEDSHFVLQSPQSGRSLPRGKAQLLRIARTHSVLHEFDEAARIYLHILRSYPNVARDGYGFLLGELYAAKAQRLAKEGGGKDRKEERRALLASARAFVQIPLQTPTSSYSANAYWFAGKNYFAARRYDGASRALAEFTNRFGDDPRLSEGLYLLGESLRRMGDGKRAATVFERCSVEHRNDQFGYLSHLALGETYLGMNRLDAVPGEKGEAAKRNARAVFEAIRRDARYTPQSLVWMKTLFHLGETYYRLGRRRLIWVHQMELAAKHGKPLRDAKARLQKMRSDDLAQPQIDAEERRVKALEQATVNPTIVAAMQDLQKLKDAMAGAEEVAGEQEWIEGLEKASANPAFISRTTTDARRNLKRAAEFLEEARERYPLSKYGKNRPSFNSFLKAHWLDSKRTLAMVYYHLGETEKAHAHFSAILEKTSKVDVSERARAEGFRREAYTFKGITEMRQDKFKEAGKTFQKAFDEFARTADGPWFCLATGMALERDGKQEEARGKYERAMSVYETLKTKTSKDEWTRIQESKAWILPIGIWQKHAQWVRDTESL
jgi:tetratricopeptide (TPR) repeat protein